MFPNLLLFVHACLPKSTCIGETVYISPLEIDCPIVFLSPVFTTSNYVFFSSFLGTIPINA